jgi:hypothetical protein
VDHASRGGSADSSRFAAGGSSFGWSFSFNNVFTDTTLKPDDLYVAAYYPGRPVTTTTPTCTPPTAGKPNPCM